MVRGKKMKNPLRKRLPRELKTEFGKYLVIFLLLVATIGLVSGFLVADGSMIIAYNEGFEKDVYKRQIIDGANIIQTFFYIILPQLKPIIATVVILHGVAAWNEYADVYKRQGFTRGSYIQDLLPLILRGLNRIILRV